MIRCDNNKNIYIYTHTRIHMYSYIYIYICAIVRMVQGLWSSIPYRESLHNGYINPYSWLYDHPTIQVYNGIYIYKITININNIEFTRIGRSGALCVIAAKCRRKNIIIRFSIMAQDMHILQNMYNIIIYRQIISCIAATQKTATSRMSSTWAQRSPGQNIIAQELLETGSQSNPHLPTLQLFSMVWTEQQGDHLPNGSKWDKHIPIIHWIPWFMYIYVKSR